MSQIAVFHGIEHKAGCTMVAQSAAELIAKEKKGLTVLFAALNGRLSTEYMSDGAVSVDEFKVRLKSGIGIDRNALSRNRRIDNLYMLAGIDKEEEARHFLPEMADVLMQSLCDRFDVIVIDSGCDIDNGLAYGALRMKGVKYLVVEQAESSVRRCERMKGIHEGLSIGFNKYVLSKHLESDPITANYLSSRLGIDKAMLLVAAHSANGRVSELERRTLLETGDERFRRDMLRIANDIMRAIGMEDISIKRRRAWNSFI